jgi:hypothetical protein
MKLHAALFILIVFTIFAQEAGGSLASFENYPETAGLKAPFVDPASAITFSNPQNSASYFGIDFGSATANVPTLPGNLLTGNGAQLGNAFGLTQNFGFDAKLPSGARSVDLDVVYLNINASAGTVVLTGISVAGTQVATATVTPTRTTSSGYLQAHLSLQSTGTQIDTFTVRTSNVAAAFDNVSVALVAAPEPGTLVMLFALGTTVLLGRRLKS